MLLRDDFISQAVIHLFCLLNKYYLQRTVFIDIVFPLNIEVSSYIKQIIAIFILNYVLASYLIIPDVIFFRFLTNLCVYFIICVVFQMILLLKMS